MNESTKAVLRQITPPILLPLGKSILRSIETRFPTTTTQLAATQQLQSEHERRNAAIAEGEIVLRDGLTLKIHPESREPFEHFCYRSPEMVEEMNSFIEHA